MNKTKTLLVIIIGLIFLVGGHFFNKWYHNNVKKLPKMYVYETYRGSANQVLIVENKRFKKELIEYYQKVEKGENPFFNFPLKTLPQREPVYVVKFSKDSLLAKVISYYDYGPMRGGSFTIGWVYSKCLHETPCDDQKTDINSK